MATFQDGEAQRHIDPALVIGAKVVGYPDSVDSLIYQASQPIDAVITGYWDKEYIHIEDISTGEAFTFHINQIKAK